MKLKPLVMSTIKDVSLKTGICNHLFFRSYGYMFEPNQLIFLTECIKSVEDVPGCFVEAGCAYGYTTVFLNKFMNGENIHRDYYAIDTFSGFTEQHASYEVSRRGKPKYIKEVFSENREAWFQKSMALGGVDRVKCIKSDVTKLDFSTVAPIAFCLLDVDLYLPIKDALPKIYAVMSPGGVIVIDDCRLGGLWDGALQAYEEFIEEKGLQREIVKDKLGIIRIER